MLNALRQLLHRSGRRVRFCPVCEGAVTEFAPLPREYEEQAKRYGYRYFGQAETINIKEYSCPACGASDRERLYMLYLSQVIRSPAFVRGSRLVHIAPEKALSQRIRQLGVFDYCTADLAMDGVDDRVDVTAMSYADGSFDAFICSHVLEHVTDDRAALRELWRILKSGGWGIIMSPVMTNLSATVEDGSVTTEVERWRLFGQGDHVRLYAKTDFLMRIMEAKFSVKQLDANYFGLTTLVRCGIAPSSVLYVVTRD
jgi:SAM-dependent methyltransferase